MSRKRSNVHLHCDKMFHCKIRMCFGDDFGGLQTATRNDNNSLNLEWNDSCLLQCDGWKLLIIAAIDRFHVAEANEKQQLFLLFIFIVWKLAFSYVGFVFVLPLDTEFKCKYRRPSVTSCSVRSLIGLKNERCNKSGRFSPRINLQWFTRSAVVCTPAGTSTSSSCESMLLIFGAELNDPILSEIETRNQSIQNRITIRTTLSIHFAKMRLAFSFSKSQQNKTSHDEWSRNNSVALKWFVNGEWKAKKKEILNENGYTVPKLVS